MSAPRPATGAEDVPFASVEEAAARLARGELVIIVDDVDRENEGDLVVAAERATPEAITFMARQGCGLICTALTPERCAELDLPLMVDTHLNTSPLGTAFCVSVEAKDGTTSGISAHDRARTVRALVDPATRPSDLVRPGHMFPLRSKRGGVLARPGHTEASIDLARVAGLTPAAVLCEVMDTDGRMARLPRLAELAHRHGLAMISVADLIAYRLRRETVVERVASPALPVAGGDFEIVGFRNTVTGEEHVALVKGDLSGAEPVLVRVHSQCLTGDVFGSRRCDCGAQLETALDRIADEGRGVLLYLLQEGRGIGLFNKLRAYELQDRGVDTVEANLHLGFPPDLRSYGSAAQMLRDLGVERLRLMTNNPHKVRALTELGIEVVERIPIEIPPTEHTRSYLETKKRKLGHHLDLV